MAEDPLKRWAARGFRKNSETSIDPKKQDALDSALGRSGELTPAQAIAKIDTYCAKHRIKRTTAPVSAGGKWEFYATKTNSMGAADGKPSKFSIKHSDL